jgi:hypothetical protein
VGQLNSTQQSALYCLPLQRRLGRANQPAAQPSASVLQYCEESDAKIGDRSEENKGFVGDRAYAKATYTATYLFTLDYVGL